MTRLTFIAMIFTNFFCFGQSQVNFITGVVLNQENEQKIPFCNIKLLNENKGCISNEEGMFKLDLQKTYTEVRLIFKAIGFEQDTFLIQKNEKELKIFLTPEIKNLDDVVVSGSTKSSLIRENPLSIATISTKQIDKAAESNIIDVLVKNTPGLNAVKTGPNISKPFIHGLGYNRVLTLFDGIRQEGQQYGDEHGIEVDDYNIEKAEVIKGPASLLYGSDAIAGVISLFPYLPKQNDGKIHGKFTSEYQTNNGLIGNGLRLSYLKKGFVFAMNGSYRMAKNYKNAIDGRVYLTNFDVKNFALKFGHQSSKGSTFINYTLFDNRQGIPDGSRDSSTYAFTKQIYEASQDHLNNREIVSNKELNSYKIPVLSQHITHQRIYVQSKYELKKGAIDFIVGGQQNHRIEYTHPTIPSQAGMNMKLKTLNYGLSYHLPSFKSLDFSFGVNGMYQQNKNLDATDFPIPDYQLLDAGTFAYSKWKINKWTISGGIRFDLRKVNWDDFYTCIDSRTNFTKKCSESNHNLQFPSFEKLYQGISGSIGASYKINSNLSLKLNIGRAYRAPNITEIGSNGLDPGAHIIYLGNRTFKPEFSLQEDFGLLFKYQFISGEINLFNNNIQNYIYMATLADENGIPIVDNQGNRTYQYQQAEAHLYGAETWISFHPEKIKGLKIDQNLSFVYGFNKSQTYKNKGVMGEYLPLIPPLMYNGQITYEITLNSKVFKNIMPKIEIEYASSQTKYLALNNTETFTKTYTLFHLGISSEFKLFKDLPIQLIAQVNNLFDKSYQSHLNRLKYFDSPNINSTHKGIYNMGRNIVFKLIIPF